MQAIEGGQADIAHRIGARTGRSFALVGKTGADLTQLRHEGIDNTHARIDSGVACRGKPNRPIRQG